MKNWIKITLILLIVLFVTLTIYYYSSLQVVNLYGQSPNITTTQCIEMDGTIESLGCKSESDFLGTVMGVKCMCVCCKK